MPDGSTAPVRRGRSRSAPISIRMLAGRLAHARRAMLQAGEVPEDADQQTREVAVKAEARWDDEAALLEDLIGLQPAHTPAEGAVHVVPACALVLSTEGADGLSESGRKQLRRFMEAAVPAMLPLTPPEFAEVYRDQVLTQG